MLKCVEKTVPYVHSLNIRTFIKQYASQNDYKNCNKCQHC